MSSTRKILDKVKPTKLLLISSMPCEKKTAKIYNQVVDCMDNENIGDVSYLRMKTGRGLQYSCNELFKYMSIFMFGMYLFMKEKEEPNELLEAMAFIVLIASLGNVLPNIANTIRYREAQNACNLWLENRIGKEKLIEVKKLDNVNDLAAFLHKQNIQDGELLYTDPDCFIQKQLV